MCAHGVRLWIRERMSRPLDGVRPVDSRTSFFGGRMFLIKSHGIIRCRLTCGRGIPRPTRRPRPESTHTRCARRGLAPACAARDGRGMTGGLRPARIRSALAVRGERERERRPAVAPRWRPRVRNARRPRDAAFKACPSRCSSTASGGEYPLLRQHEPRMTRAQGSRTVVGRGEVLYCCPVIAGQMPP